MRQASGVVAAEVPMVGVAPHRQQQAPCPLCVFERRVGAQKAEAPPPRGSAPSEDSACPANLAEAAAAVAWGLSTGTPREGAPLAALMAATGSLLGAERRLSATATGVSVEARSMPVTIGSLPPGRTLSAAVATLLAVSPSGLWRITGSWSLMAASHLVVGTSNLSDTACGLSVTAGSLSAVASSRVAPLLTGLLCC